MTREVSFGSRKIVYDLRHSRRSTFALTVRADGCVIAKAPLVVDAADADRRVRRRGAWILRQLRRAIPGAATSRSRRYVSGSSVYLFGRELQLRVRKARESSVVIERPILWVRSSRVKESDIAALVERWRTEVARERFLLRMCALVPRVLGRDTKLPPVRLAAMRRRWGSCSQRGMISLNPWLSEHPMGCVDYVLLHELCHLKHMDHGPRFRALLERLLPDWRRWKGRLDRKT